MKPNIAVLAVLLVLLNVLDSRPHCKWRHEHQIKQKLRQCEKHLEQFEAIKLKRNGTSSEEGSKSQVIKIAIIFFHRNDSLRCKQKWSKLNYQISVMLLFFKELIAAPLS